MAVSSWFNPREASAKASASSLFCGNGRMHWQIPRHAVQQRKANRRCHQDTQIEVVPFAVDMIAAASRLYEARSDKDWNLTDCLSFLVMEQRRVSRARTTDHHFRQAGF
jgi:hypothetical protein